MKMKFAIPYGYNTERNSFLAYSDNRHLFTSGNTRSGKGSCVIVQALLQVPHSVVVIDPKGQNAAITANARRAMGQDVYVLNPFGLHTASPWKLPRHRFNPLAGLDINSPHVVSQAAGLANALIVTQSREPYFDDTARDLIKTIILYLAATLGPRATLGHLRKIVTDIAVRGDEAARLLVAMKGMPQPFISQPIGRFMDAEARDISSAVNTAITQTATFLDDPVFTDPTLKGVLTDCDFSFSHLKNKPTTVYLILPGHQMDEYSRFLRLMITAAINAVVAGPGGHPVLMILDEFARLENLPAVMSAFSYAAGFNLQLWPFVQDLAQLEATYGKAWTSILANCGMMQFFTPTDIGTAEYLQRRGGTLTGESVSKNYSGSVIKGQRGESRSQSRIPLLPPEMTMSLPPDQSITFFAGKHDPLIAERKPYWTIPRLEGQFMPDPFHLK